MPVPENHQIDYISGNSKRRINISVSTHIFSGVRNPVKALFSVLDHYNMLQHAKYTFQMVCHMFGPENRLFDYNFGKVWWEVEKTQEVHI